MEVHSLITIRFFFLRWQETYNGHFFLAAVQSSNESREFQIILLGTLSPFTSTEFLGENIRNVFLFTSLLLLLFTAKLMETLQTVTPTSSTTVKTAEDVDVNNVDVLCPVSTPTTSTTNLMAQSMPASVLSGQLEQVQAVEALSKTCNSLQSQVVQLQSSLAGVMHFMSAFQQPPATLIEQQPQPSIRGRHSSNDASVASESAAAGLSYSYFTPIQMTQSVGPMSLPIQPATAAAVASMTSRPTLTLNKTLSEVMDSQGMAMSRYINDYYDIIIYSCN